MSLLDIGVALGIAIFLVIIITISFNYYKTNISNRTTIKSKGKNARIAGRDFIESKK